MQNEGPKGSESIKKVDPQKVWDSLSPHSKIGRNEKRLDQEMSAWLLNVLFVVLIILGCSFVGEVSKLFHPAYGAIAGGVFGFVIAMVYYGISSVLVELNRNLRRIATTLESNNS